jgi:hypothetical protein
MSTRRIVAAGRAPLDGGDTRAVTIRPTRIRGHFPSLETCPEIAPESRAPHKEPSPGARTKRRSGRTTIGAATLRALWARMDRRGREGELPEEHSKLIGADEMPMMLMLRQSFGLGVRYSSQARN